MEDINMNETMPITNEEVNEILDVMPKDKNVLKTVGLVGAGLAGAALLTKFVLIPTGRKLAKAIRNRKTKRIQEADYHVEDDKPEEMQQDETPDAE